MKERLNSSGKSMKVEVQSIHQIRNTELCFRSLAQHDGSLMEDTVFLALALRLVTQNLYPKSTSSQRYNLESIYVLSVAKAISDQISWVTHVLQKISYEFPCEMD